VVDESSVVRTGMLSRFTLERGRNTIPHLDSLSFVRRKLPIADVRQQLVLGFCAMHRFLAAKGRNADLKRAVRSMRQIESRYIYRPTWWYQELIDESIAPHHLCSVGGRQRFLHSRLEDGLCDAVVVRSEIRQLSCGDIPIFHGPAASARNELTDVQCTAAIATLLGSP
jgi:lantibiotic modifying enzyme